MTYAMLGMMRQTRPEMVRDMPPSTLAQLSICLDSLAEMVNSERARRIELEEERIRRHAQALCDDMEFERILL
jgi:hypothetical protein